MWKKRTLVMLALIQLGLLLLIGRLAQIQLIDTESFANHNLIAESVAQRTQELIIDDGRGSFIDRNGAPLTKRYVPSLVLFPFLTAMKWPMEQVARIAGVSEEEIRRQLEQEDGPFVLEKDGEPLALSAQQMKQINDLRIPGGICRQQAISAGNGVRPAFAWLHPSRSGAHQEALSKTAAAAKDRSGHSRT